MAENYNYQLMTGIVKVIRPKNKPVLGVADGKGKFMWLPTDKIIISHPNQYENWQTTIFALDPSWKLNWKDEQKWEEFKGSYPANTKPVPQPIPQMFLQPRLPAPVQQQPQFTTANQPLNNPQPSQTYPAQNVYQPPVQQQPQFANPQPIQVSPVAETLERIALTLESMERLLRLYINPPQFTQADKLTEDAVIQEYGEPPSELITEIGTDDNVNKDELPDIF